MLKHWKDKALDANLRENNFQVDTQKFQLL